MDPGSSAQPLNPQGALDRFACEHGADFVHLRRARQLADERIRGAFAELAAVAPMRSLGARFHQLVVITHMPDIADLCDHELVVSLAEPGRSVAEIRSS